MGEEPYNELRTKIEAQKISMPARTGVISPCDVVIPPGPTGIEVGKIDLFHKLNIQCKTVKSAIEMSMSDITKSFEKYAGYLTAASLGANIPNALSVPQFIANGFKTMLAIGSESGYSFRQLEDALSAAQNVAATTSVAADNKVEAKVEEQAAAQDEEESEDLDMGGLFD